MSSAQRQQLTSFWAGSLQWDVPMGEHCTLRAGGRAEALVQAATLPEFCRLIAWLREQGIPWRVIGRGSNILVSSRGFEGVLVIFGGELSEIRPVGPGPEAGSEAVEVGAGCSAGRFLGWCIRHGLSGFEFMAGIPGSIGGAVHMNAGAWGQEIGNLLDEVTVVDRRGGVHHLPVAELALGYRRLRPRSPALAGAVVAAARITLVAGNRAEILERCRDILARRRAKQPAGVGSAGSFFKNPPGDYAGRLIEAAGLKGLRRGRAMVSSKHANFIVNTGGASADDIIGLMEEVQERVFRFSGVRLEPEVHLL